MSNVQIQNVCSQEYFYQNSGLRTVDNSLLTLDMENVPSNPTINQSENLLTDEIFPDFSMPDHERDDPDYDFLTEFSFSPNNSMALDSFDDSHELIEILNDSVNNDTVPNNNNSNNYQDLSFNNSSNNNNNVQLSNNNNNNNIHPNNNNNNNIYVNNIVNKAINDNGNVNNDNSFNCDNNKSLNTNGSTKKFPTRKEYILNGNKLGALSSMRMARGSPMSKVNQQSTTTMTHCHNVQNSRGVHGNVSGISQGTTGGGNNSFTSFYNNNVRNSSSSSIGGAGGSLSNSFTASRDGIPRMKSITNINNNHQKNDGVKVYRAQDVMMQNYKLSQALASVNKNLFNSKAKNIKDQEKDNNKLNLTEKLNESMEQKRKMLKIETQSKDSVYNQDNEKENKPTANKILNRSVSLLNPIALPTSSPPPSSLSSSSLIPRELQKRLKVTPIILKKKQLFIKRHGHLSMSVVTLRQFTPSKFLNNPLSSTPVSKRIRNRKASNPPVIHVGTDTPCPPCKKQIFLSEEDGGVKVEGHASKQEMVEVKDEDEDDVFVVKRDLAPPTSANLDLHRDSLVCFETPSKTLCEDDELLMSPAASIRLNLFSESISHLKATTTTNNNNINSVAKHNNIVEFSSQQNATSNGMLINDVKISNVVDVDGNECLDVDRRLSISSTSNATKEQNNMDSISEAFMKVVCCDTTHKQLLLQQAKDFFPIITNNNNDDGGGGGADDINNTTSFNNKF